MIEDTLTGSQMEDLIKLGIPVRHEGSLIFLFTSKNLWNLLNETLKHVEELNPNMKFAINVSRGDVGAEQWIGRNQYHPLVNYTASLLVRIKNCDVEKDVFTEVSENYMESLFFLICEMAKAGMMNFLKENK